MGVFRENASDQTSKRAAWRTVGDQQTDSASLVLPGWRHWKETV